MDMSVDLCGVKLKNPVMTASGTFGSGEEYSEFLGPKQAWCSRDEGGCKRAMGG